MGQTTYCTGQLKAPRRQHREKALMKHIVVPIIPRRMQFDFACCSTLDWCGQDLIHTAYMNGVSLALPIGEHFFIRSVRQFEDQVDDPALQDELKRFVAQEAIHSRQHQQYNAQLVKDGFEIAGIEAHVSRLLDEVWEQSRPLERLACTIALEHLTHVMADCIAGNRERLSDWDPEFRAFWLWHAAEEIEHKAVCYDLFTRLGGTYRMRSSALLTMSRRMLAVFWHGQQVLLAQACAMRGIDVPSSGRIARSNLDFMLGRPDGLLRGVELPYLAWFRPGYHPWKQDNRKMLASWQREILPLNHVSDVPMG